MAQGTDMMMIIIIIIIVIILVTTRYCGKKPIKSSRIVPQLDHHHDHQQVQPFVPFDEESIMSHCIDIHDRSLMHPLISG